MLAVGLGIVFAGFTLEWYGVSLVKHRGLSLLDLVVPGYYAKNGISASTTNATAPPIGPSTQFNPSNPSAGGYITGAGGGTFYLPPGFEHQPQPVV